MPLVCDHCQKTKIDTTYQVGDCSTCNSLVVLCHPCVENSEVKLDCGSCGSQILSSRNGVTFVRVENVTYLQQ